MSRPSSTASTCAAQWKMWLFKVIGVMYVTAACAAEDPQDVTHVFSDESPTSSPPRTPPPPPPSTAPPTVYEPPVPVLQLTSAWLEVFPSEKVQFSCSVAGSSDWTFSWYRNDTELHPASDQSWSSPGDGSVLTITAAATHSGRYSCKGRHKTRSVASQSSSSLELRVSEQQPKPRMSRSPDFGTMFPGESVTFSCVVDVSSGWEYQWFHDGQQLPASNDSTYKIASVDRSHTGRYHCRARRGPDPFYTEASETTSLQVSDPPTPTLRQLTPWSDVFEDELVSFSCEVNGPGWTFSWYKNQDQLKEGSWNLALDEEGSALNITVTKEYEGRYACRAHLTSRGVSSALSNTTEVTVYDNVPKPTLSKEPGLNPMYVGETVNFTCRVGVSSGWVYRWYRDDGELADTSETISISLGPSAAGKYSCNATRGEATWTEDSEKLQQDVVEVPVPSARPVTRWLDVFPSEAAVLSCGMPSGSGWTYTWYKDTQEVQADRTVSFDSDGATLSISSSSAQHAGQYECRGRLQGRTVSSRSSPQLALTVYDQKPSVTLTQSPQYKLMFPGEVVSFSCHINVSSGWEYLWFKDDGPFTASGNQHSVSLVGGADSGSYSCRARRGSQREFTSDSSPAVQLQVQDTKPRVTLVQNPDHSVMHTGDSVSFSCHINVSSGWEYLWYKDGKALGISRSRHSISSVGTADSGSYKCEAERGTGAAVLSQQSQAVTLDVQERPQAGIVLLTGWSEVFSTDSLVLRCEVTEFKGEWNYTWFREGERVEEPPSERHIVTPQNDPQQSLYTCQGHRSGRPSYSKSSEAFTTKNLLLKRRVLLSISGCLFFGIIAVLLGCIVLRVFRKPAAADERPEEDNLFLSMKDYTDAPCPLVEYITDAALSASPKEADENGTICSETTPLPITSQEAQAVTSDGHDNAENNGLVSFQQ